VPYSRSGIKEIGTGFISTQELRSSQQNDCNNFNKKTKKRDFIKGNWIYSNNRKTRLTSTKDLTRGKLRLSQQKDKLSQRKR